MFYIRLIQTCSIASTVPGAGTRSRRGYPQPARVPADGAGTRSRRGYPQTARVPADGAGTRSDYASSLQYKGQQPSAPF